MVVHHSGQEHCVAETEKPTILLVFSCGLTKMSHTHILPSTRHPSLVRGGVMINARSVFSVRFDVCHVPRQVSSSHPAPHLINIKSPLAGQVPPAIAEPPTLWPSPTWWPSPTSQPSPPSGRFAPGPLHGYSLCGNPLTDPPPVKFYGIQYGTSPFGFVFPGQAGPFMVESCPCIWWS